MDNAVNAAVTIKDGSELHVIPIGPQTSFTVTDPAYVEETGEDTKEKDEDDD